MTSSLSTAPAARTLVPRIATSLLEITGPDPDRRSRVVLITVCGLLTALVVWACASRVDVVAVAPGRLVPQTYVKIVQPAEGGIIREILVKEGDRVQKGDVLARLDGTVARADARSAKNRLAAKQLDLRRIDAQLAGRPLPKHAGDDAEMFAQAAADAAARARAYSDQRSMEEALLARTRSELASAEATLRKLEASLPSYEREARAYADLAERKLVGRLAAEEKRRIAAEWAADVQAQTSYVIGLRSGEQAQERKLAQVTSTYRSQLQSERVEAVSAIEMLEQETSKQGFRESLLELRAPQDAIVNEVATTSLGAVLQPGSVLVTLVPDNEPLFAEVYIDNRDVGFVREGQRTKIKIDAYQFTRYGFVEGEVISVSADSSQPRQVAGSTERMSVASSSFRALVRLSQQHLQTSSQSLRLSPGMSVQAEVIQGSRTVLEYLLSPVARVASESSRER